MLRSLPKAQDCRRLLRRASELELSDSAVQKLKWFLFCAEHYFNVSLTCRHFGISRSTFLRWAQRFNPESIDSLEEISRRPHRVRSSETSMQLLEQIANIRREFPEMGKIGVTEMLQSRHGVTASSATVGRIITRFGLFFGDTPSHKQKRSDTDLQDSDDSLPSNAAQSIDPDDPLTDSSGLVPLHGLSS